MIKLNILVLFSLVCLAIAKPKRDRVDFVRVSRYCSKDVNLPRDDASKLLRGILERTDETAQCFVKCFYVQTKVMDDDGNFNLERLKRVIPKALFPKEKIEGWIDACRQETGAELCEKAFNTYGCFIRQAYPEEGKVPNGPKSKLEVKPMALALYNLESINKP